MSEELPPVRCVTCNKVLGHYWNAYQNLLIEGYSIEEALNKLKLARYCCRMRMMNPAKILSQTRNIEADLPMEKEKGREMDLLTANMRNMNISTKSTKGLIENPTISIPEEEEIQLPDMPTLPDLPTKPIDNTTFKKFEAW